MSKLEAAEKVVRELEAKREKCLQAGVELQDERAALAYSAHADGNAKSRSRLEQVHAAIATHSSELQSIDAAIAQAKGKLAIAHRDEAEEQDRARATAIQQVVAELATHAAVADDCLHDLAEAGNNLKKCLDRLHVLGVGPRHEQLQALGHNCVLTALMTSPWKRYFEAIPANARRDFASTIASWRTMIESGLRSREGEQQQKEREVA
jgi:hypothetical protein